MTANNGSGVSRRGFISGIAVGSVALSAPGTLLAKNDKARAAKAASGAQADPLIDLSTPVRELLGEIQPGVEVMPGWSVSEVGTRAGAVAVFVRSDSGDDVRVDVCRRDPQGQTGVVVTEHFELVIMNHGEGQEKTPREHELVARVLGRTLGKNEANLAAAPKELTTHKRRVQLFQSNVLFHPEPSDRA